MSGKIKGANVIQAEYLRFMQTLLEQNATEAEIKIANIIYDHLDEITPLRTHQGQRIKKVVQLASKHWANAQGIFVPPLPIAKELKTHFKSIKSMTVGPFRGFAKQESFDLDSRLILIYGPNGTGKTSFCEALEYALLGNVAEAESKRFRNQNDYLKNAFVNELEYPTMTVLNDDGHAVPVLPNEANNRFCFVEKNRIDSFSRIAAQAPAKQTELISTLFGLDSFTDFVKNFSSEIAAQYIDLVGKNSEKYKLEEEKIITARQQLGSNEAEFNRLTNEQAALANEYKPGSTYEQMVIDLNGNEQTPGIIKTLNDELQLQHPPKSLLTVNNVVHLGNETAAIINEYNLSLQQFSLLSKEISYKQLFEAVTQLQVSNPNACPACLTPLNEVRVNPYTRATDELGKLKQLGDLQNKVHQLQAQANAKIANVKQVINICINHFPQNNVLHHLLIEPGQTDLQLWTNISFPTSNGKTYWQILIEQVASLENRDAQIDTQLNLRQQKAMSLDRLRQIQQKAALLDNQKQIALNRYNQANQQIIEFNEANRQLIANVDAEKLVVAKNKEIYSAYSSFVKKLNKYNEGLPAQLVADLGEQVVQLYNSFNKNDGVNELLAHVRLPLAQNKRLEISFQGQPDMFYDALHILSEGHVRCLGLAILLAKNLKENVPVLIFDDPVNAIDDEHREAIRRTLFEEQYFAEKQIILTCHGEEFFKDIQNLLPVKEVKKSKTLCFLPRLGEQHIRIDPAGKPRNYIVAAQMHMQNHEIRDALTKSRQALEALAKGKIWRYVSKYGDGSLSIKLRSASSPIELRNLTEQLKKKISDNAFMADNKEAVLTPVIALLGINGNSREWRYLNKGTHEEVDRTEFDRGSVEAIVNALTEIDAAVN